MIALVLAILLQSPFADGFQYKAMLLPKDVLFPLVCEVRALRLVGVRGGTLPDAASANEDLGLKKKIAFASLALHVVDRVVVFDIRVEAKNHLCDFFPFLANRRPSFPETVLDARQRFRRRLDQCP